MERPGHGPRPATAQEGPPLIRGRGGAYGGRLVRLSLIALLVSMLCAAPAAAEPAAERFVCPRSITVSPVWLVRGPRLEVHVAVLHQCEKTALCHDGRTYALDERLAERLQEDFGALAPLALRRIEQRLMETTGPQRDARVRRAILCALDHIHSQLPYRVEPHVFMRHNTELWVHRLALSFVRRRGHVLTITSGTRAAAKQAAAMYGKLARRRRYRSLYKKRELAEEIRQTYLSTRRKGKRAAEIIAAMTATIEDQIRRGLYVSAHLKQVAVDVRSYDMPRRLRRAFRRMVESFEGMSLLLEKRPPHFHLEVPATPAVPGCPHLEVLLPSTMPASAPTSAPTTP